MHRRLTAPPAEEAGQGALQETEAFEVVVVRDFAAEPLPDRLDRVQVGAVGRQEAEPQARVPVHEREERRAAMPGRPIEDHDHQPGGVGAQQLSQEPLEVVRGQPRRQAVMEPSGPRVEGPEAVDLLMGPRPVARPRLLADEAPLPAEGRGELDGHFVLEEHDQPLRGASGQAQEPTEVSFFSRRRQTGTVGN